MGVAVAHAARFVAECCRYERACDALCASAVDKGLFRTRTSRASRPHRTRRLWTLSHGRAHQLHPTRPSSRWYQHVRGPGLAQQILSHADRNRRRAGRREFVERLSGSRDRNISRNHCVSYPVAVRGASTTSSFRSGTARFSATRTASLIPAASVPPEITSHTLDSLPHDSGWNGAKLGPQEVKSRSNQVVDAGCRVAKCDSRRTAINDESRGYVRRAVSSKYGWHRSRSPRTSRGRPRRNPRRRRPPRAPGSPRPGSPIRAAHTRDLRRYAPGPPRDEELGFGAERASAS